MWSKLPCVKQSVETLKISHNRHSPQLASPAKQGGGGRWIQIEEIRKLFYYGFGFSLVIGSPGTRCL